MMKIHMHNYPLKQLDELLLAVEFFERAEALGFAEDAKSATVLAAYCHLGQTRANRGNLPRDTYMTHPLRNTVRLMRYGLTDRDILIACVLHDTVEDAAERIVQSANWAVLMKHDSPESKAEYFRMQALRFIEFEYGEEVARLVKAVSNPLPVAGENLNKGQKREQYQKFVTEKIKDPKVAVLKLSDFIDNAAGLYHNTGMHMPALNHLTQKYYPLCDVFYDRLFEADVYDQFTELGLQTAAQQLTEAKQRLAGLMILR